MKKIEAIIRPQMVEEVKNALADINIAGMTLTEVRGFGNQKGFVDHFRNNEIYVSLLPKMEIKIIVNDEQVDQVVKVIIEAARTGEVGDGKIFVSSVDEVYRIRTGDRGAKAI
ncbi:MAG: P-II family nitrogen regulator [bacterium]